MAQKYYNTKETAEALGITPDDVKGMLDRRELYGYRDGADWKFKAEDIDRLAQERAAQPAEPAEERDEVLLSEVELGPSSTGASGTIIAMAGPRQGSPESDLLLAGSSIKLEEGGVTPAPAGKDDAGSKVAQFEDLDLDQNLSLEGSGIAATPKAAEATRVGDSAVDLTGQGLEDDDLVLGGSGTGSDITIGGDSGISLVDPTDSGLSLEEPLNMAAGTDESLELGDADMVTLPEDTGIGAASEEAKTDDDFLLTPLEEVGEEEDSESGSQVIALDSESDDSATLVASSAPASMAAMLDEDTSAAEPALGLGAGAALADLGMGAPAAVGPSAALAAEAPIGQPSFAIPETPYKTVDIVLLGVSVFVLTLCGMFVFDLMRNMHSWGSAYSFNSALMDMILGK